MCVCAHVCMCAHALCLGHINRKVKLRREKSKGRIKLRGNGVCVLWKKKGELFGWMRRVSTREKGGLWEMNKNNGDYV